MDYQQLNATVKAQLQGKRMKLYGILVVLLISIACINQVGSLKFISSNNVLYVSYLLVTLGIAIVQNTVYFIFIKCVREEKFTKQDVTYSFSKSLYHIACSLIMSLIQIAIQTILLMVISYVPMLADPVLLCVQVLLSSVSLYIAFAIYDRTKGIMQIVSGSFILLKRNIKSILMSAIPYIIWSLICTLAMNYVINTMVTGTTQSFAQALETTLSTPESVHVGFYILGIYAANIVVGAYFLVALYIAYANIYQKDYKDCFPQIAKIGSKTKR